MNRCESCIHGASVIIKDTNLEKVICLVHLDPNNPDCILFYEDDKVNGRRLNASSTRHANSDSSCSTIKQAVQTYIRRAKDQQHNINLANNSKESKAKLPNSKPNRTDV